VRVLKGLGIGVLALVVLGGLLAVLPPGRNLISEKLALKRGADAYLIGYPLVTMERTRQALTQSPAQMNAFAHARYLPDGNTGVSVVSPSRDTVYSSAWLDLSDGPLIVEQPDMGERFWLMPVLDAWTNVIADPGTRTLGNDPHRLLITGPDWSGQVPDGMIAYRSPTDLAWAILRIQADTDLEPIARLQDGFRIAPLSDPQAYQTPAVFDRPRSVVDVRADVDGLTGQQFFTELAGAMAGTPLSPPDPAAQEALSRIGVSPGAFDADALSPAQAAGLADVPAVVQEAMTAAVESGEGATIDNGWRVPPMTLGAYGTQYPVRAAVAREGLGANLPADAVYATATTDERDEPLRGGRTYTIDMPADVPVRAFWSVTVYDERGYLLPGPTEGVAVRGTADTGPRRIVVAAQRPSDPEVAWLRAPDSGGFRLLMRLYWPQQSVLDGQWAFPPVTRM
jgi:hypothetical protein